MKEKTWKTALHMSLVALAILAITGCTAAQKVEGEIRSVERHAIHATTEALSETARDTVYALRKLNEDSEKALKEVGKTLPADALPEDAEAK